MYALSRAGAPLDTQVHVVTPAMTMVGFRALGADMDNELKNEFSLVRADEWLERTLTATPAMNAHFAWFHVAEDEISHRGQIRWLRCRIKQS